MNTFVQAVQEFGCARPIQALAVAVANRAAVQRHSGAAAGYVAGIAPLAEHISIFVHPEVVSLALPPDVAESYAQAGSFGLEADNDATWYVRPTAEQLAHAPLLALAAEAADKSLTWRAGQPVSRCGQAPIESRRRACEKHWLEPNARGECAGCAGW